MAAENEVVGGYVVAWAARDDDTPGLLESFPVTMSYKGLSKWSYVIWDKSPRNVIFIPLATSMAESMYMGALSTIIGAIGMKTRTGADVIVHLCSELAEIEMGLGTAVEFELLDGGNLRVTAPGQTFIARARKERATTST